MKLEFDNNKENYFSKSFIQSIDWRQFEKLCYWAFKAKHYDIRLTGSGPDGGIDAVIYQDGKKVCYLQFKAGRSQIQASVVRELYGVMCSDEIGRGVVISSNQFGKAAKRFANKNSIILLSGRQLLTKFIHPLPIQIQKRVFEKIDELEIEAPSCSKCEDKMVAKKNYKGKLFWGCSNFPKCQNSLNYVSPS